MLVALVPTGKRVEAARDLEAAPFGCPRCGSAVVLKRGRVKVAHFAHKPNAVCDWASESISHHLAKRVLADRFRGLGYVVELEEPHAAVNRRVDVAVTMPTGHRIAVEVQDSAISVTEMKRRNHADKRAGFFGTAWVFTSKRAARLLAARADHEVRIPDEIRWVHDRYGLGVFVIDENAGLMWHCYFGKIVRPGEYREWYTPDGDLEEMQSPRRTLRSTKTVRRKEVGFKLMSRQARYNKPGSPDLAVVFAEGAEHPVASTDLTAGTVPRRAYTC